MSLKTWIPLGLAIVLGLVAGKVGLDMAGRKAGKSQAGGTRVVVATGSLAPGRELHQEDLQMAAIAAEAAPESTFVDPSQLVGRVLMSPLVKGQPVIEPLLAPLGAGSGLQALVPPGMRAVTVEINEVTGVAGLLTPGCRVDVISTFHDAETESTATRLVVQNVKVTAVGQRVSPGTSSEPQEPSKSVTLIATPREAAAIELAASTGRPRLVLRSSKDNAPSDFEGVTLAELRGQPAKGGDPFGPTLIEYVPPKPSTQPSDATKPAAPVEPIVRRRSVQVIRAGTESQVVFEMRPAPDGSSITNTGSEPVTQ